MHLKDVLNKCKEEDYPITASGLYYAGIKNGFLTKKEGNRNLDFNKEKFFEWLEKAKEEIPEGWVSINQLHDNTYNFYSEEQMLDAETIFIYKAIILYIIIS